MGRASVSRSGEDWRRPLRDLLLLMPHLPINAEGEIDYAAADPDLLVQIAEDADCTMNTIHLGVSAIGNLLAYVSPEVEMRDISGDVNEALGWLLAELGDFAAVAHSLLSPCRRYTADYAPRERKRFPHAKT